MYNRMNIDIYQKPKKTPIEIVIYKQTKIHTYMHTNRQNTDKHIKTNTHT